MIKKLLIYNSGGGIGDSIQLFPLILSLEKIFKKSEIYYLGSHENHYLGKLKVASNILTGSLTGRVVFGDQYNPSPDGNPRINPAGVINKWTGIGIAGKIYSLVVKQMGLPEQATIGRIGTKLIYGGAVGGFFDPPSSQGRVSTYAVTPNVMVQNRATTQRRHSQFRRNLNYVPPDSFDYSTGSAFR